MIKKIKEYTALCRVFWMLASLGKRCIIRHSVTGTLYRYQLSRVSIWGVQLDGIDYDESILVDFVDMVNFKAFRPEVHNGN